MPKFMKVATTDELEDQQAKMVEVEGQKIAMNGFPVIARPPSARAG